MSTTSAQPREPWRVQPPERMPRAELLEALRAQFDADYLAALEEARATFRLDRLWQVSAGETTEDLKALFQAECARSRQIVAAARLEEVARSGGRFNPPDQHPALIWILSHVLREHARHAGHLDVVRAGRRDHRPVVAARACLQC